MSDNSVQADDDAGAASRKSILPLVVAITLAAVLYVLMARGGTLVGLMAAALGLCAAFFATRWRDAPLVMLAVMVTAELSVNLTGSFGVPPVTSPVVAAVAALLLWRFLRGGERPFASASASLAILGFSALGFASLLYAQYWNITLATAYSNAKAYLVVLVTLACIRNPRDLRLYFDTVLATLCVICALGFFRYLTGYGGTFGGFAALEFVQRRFAGPLTDANFFALTLAAMVPVALSRLLTGPGTGRRLFGAVAAAMLFAGLLLTSSRGGLLAALVALATMLFLLPPHQRLRAFAVMAVAAVATSIFLSDALIARMSFLFEPEVAAPTVDVSVEGRLASWAVARELFLNHPLLGVGLGNFNAYFQDTALHLGLIFRGEGRSAHSLYLETAAELGLLGLVVQLAIFVTALLRPLRCARLLEATGQPLLAVEVRILSVSLVAIFVARVFLHDDYPILMWTLIGAALGLPKLLVTSGYLPRPDRTLR